MLGVEGERAADRDGLWRACVLKRGIYRLDPGWREIRKIDCHMHVNGGPRKWGWDSNDRIIDAADRLGIERLCVSIPITRGIPAAKDRSRN